MSYNENLIILFELEDGFSPADLLTFFAEGIVAVQLFLEVVHIRPEFVMRASL